MITEQQKEYFDAMEQMQSTKGWKLFINDLQGNIEAIRNSIMSIDTLEKFHVAKGRFLTLTDIIGLEQYLVSTKQALEQNDLEDVNASL